MNEEFEKPGQHTGRVPTDGGKNDRLYWRASLGQATLELLDAAKPVTIESLIGHLESSERLDHLVLTKVSTKAAIEVLRSLPRRGAAEEPDR